MRGRKTATHGRARAFRAAPSACKLTTRPLTWTSKIFGLQSCLTSNEHSHFPLVLSNRIDIIDPPCMALPVRFQRRRGITVTRLCCLFAAVVGLLAAWPGSGQVTTATIYVSVVDGSGAAIPNASIPIENELTSAVSPASSDSSGEFTV